MEVVVNRKNFEVTIKLRNNQLKSRRKELGLGIIELCKRVHISAQAYMDLEGLKVSPMHERTIRGRRAGAWRQPVLKLAEYFGCSPASCADNTRDRDPSRCGRKHHSKYGYHGVHLRQSGRWEAVITVDNRKIHLGTFDSPHDAARAYNAAAIKYHGAFARLNEIREDLDA
jgi:hypothetical protein